jgi:lantibiotic modifying enzyme
VARNLGSLELQDASVELLNRLDDCGQTFGSDLLSGRAGIVVGLLLLKTLLAIDGLAEAAAAQGQLLIEDAEKSHIGGRAWRSDRGPARSGLTGLSHGASGVALALTRLSEATGMSEFMDVARKEVLYERSLFNPFYRNWPDLRGVRSRTHKPEHHYRFPTYWCYGAPGISVSRIAAWRHTREDDYLEEARVALRSTFDWTSRAFAQNSELGCLCHGILGNALVLKDADALDVPSDAAEQRELSRVIAGQVARSILDEKTLFGTSVKNVDVPSLMLGFAGVGNYMLSFIDDPVADRFVSPLSLSTRSEDPPSGTRQSHELRAQPAMP